MTKNCFIWHFPNPSILQVFLLKDWFHSVCNNFLFPLLWNLPLLYFSFFLLVQFFIGSYHEIFFFLDRFLDCHGLCFTFFYGYFFNSTSLAFLLAMIKISSKFSNFKFLKYEKTEVFFVFTIDNEWVPQKTFTIFLYQYEE